MLDRPRLTPAALDTAIIARHPAIHRLVVRTITVSADATSYEPAAPLIPLAEPTVAAIRAGAATLPPSN